MKLFDVNVLIYAYHPDSARHDATRQWLEAELNRPAAFGMSELVLSAFVRIVTNPKAFENPVPIAKALDETDCLRSLPNCVSLRPGPRHYELFTGLCRDAAATGKLVADAYHAALALEHGCEWVSFDRDFSKFNALTWLDLRTTL